MSQHSFNLGNVSEQYAKQISPVVHKAWKHHNAALILNEILAPKCNTFLDEGAYCKNGISMHDLLKYVINVPDTAPSKNYTRRIRELLLESVLYDTGNTKMILARFAIYVSHLKKVAKPVDDNFLPGQIMSELLEVIIHA